MRRTRSLLLGIVVAGSLVPAAVLAAARPASAEPPSPVSALYFAEGNTLPGWYQFLTILNPSPSTSVTTTITYACEQPAGTKVSCGIAGDTVTRTIAPLTRITVSVSDPGQGGVNGIFTGVGATLNATGPIVAERPFYLEQPAGAFAQIPTTLVGATNTRAVRPSKTWFLPEGTTQADFQQYLTILNPNNETVLATITYSIEGSSTPVIKTRSLAAGARTTIDVVSTGEGGLGMQVVGLSTIVTAAKEIVVERPLFFDHNFGGGVGLINGATAAAGAKQGLTPGGTLTFAEGNGLADFEQFFTILNTENKAGTVSISYLVEGLTTPVVRSCSIGALARLTVNASQTFVPGTCGLGRENAGSSAGRGVGASISSDVAIAAERPMYFNRSFPEIGVVNGAHDVFGVATPGEAANEYFFAEGSTRSGFDQFWTIANTNTSTINVAVSYLYDKSGAGKAANETITYTVNPNSRRTVQVFNPADNGVGRNGNNGYDFGARATASFADGKPAIFGMERPFYTTRQIAAITTNEGHIIPGASPQEVFGATPIKTLTTTLTAIEEIPPGDPDGSGFAEFDFYPNGIVCVDLTTTAVASPLTGAHIHVGAAGMTGTVVIDFSSVINGPNAFGCVQDPDGDVDINKVLSKPEAFYVNVHNAAHPAGAIRGQLGDGEIAIGFNSVTRALHTWNTENPTATVTSATVSGFAQLPAAEPVLGADLRPLNNTSYVLTTDTVAGVARLYTLNLASTSVSQVITTGITGLNLGGGVTPRVGLDFNPAVDRIRLTAVTDTTAGTGNYRLHPATGALVAQDTFLNYVPGDVNASDLTPQIGGAAYTSNVTPSITPTTLFYVATDFETLVRSPSPNTGTLATVGSLGIGLTTPYVAFDIAPAPDTLPGMLYLVDSIRTYAVNPVTGRATPLGNLPIVVGALHSVTLLNS